MIAAAVLLLAQVASDTPQRMSILAPDCANPPSNGDEIVVCAGNASPTRLPLPNERAPVGPLPLNPALMVDPAPRPGGGAPCAARLEGCPVGFGLPLVPIVNAAAGLARGVFARHPDKSGRVSIPIDDATPGTTSTAKD